MSGAVPPPRNDNSRPAPPDEPAVPAAPSLRIGADLVGALRFYSRVPIGFAPHEPPNLERMAPVLPLASLAIGVPPAAVLVVGTWAGLPSVYAAGLGVVLGLLLTGAMAEDALADAFDGLFGSAIPERRLEIMRDSRHGTYGVCAISMLLVMRVLAVGAIGAVHPLAGAGAWLSASTLGRSTALWLAVALPPARADGASAAAGRLSRRAFGIGVIVAVVAAAVLSIAVAGPMGVALAVVVALGLTAVWTRLCDQLVRGQTGDLIGALQALVELGALTVFLAFA